MGTKKRSMKALVETLPQDVKTLPLQGFFVCAGCHWGNTPVLHGLEGNDTLTMVKSHYKKRTDFNHLDAFCFTFGEIMIINMRRMNKELYKIMKKQVFDYNQCSQFLADSLTRELLNENNVNC